VAENHDDRLPAHSAHYLHEGASVTATRYERTAVNEKRGVVGSLCEVLRNIGVEVEI
jgi:hypothetical protein